MSRLGIFKSISDPVLVVDSNGLLIEANDAFLSSFNAAETGKPVADAWPEIAHLWRTTTIPATLGALLRVDVPAIDPDGLKLVYNVSLSAVHEPASDAVVIAAVARDVTAERAGKTALELQATTDSLTGAYNRVQLELLLDREIRVAIRRKTASCFLLFDVDKFKQINDKRGHAEGDRVLKEFAAVLHKNLRASDVVARYGGDEFGVILTDTGRESGLRKAQQLAESLGRIAVQGDETGITTSVGLAQIPDDGEHVADLVEHADAAMYQAKRESDRSVVAWRSSPTE
ncbi:MAG: diguanylate cyclase [Chloroflexi bacterium]|nr:diguanylate cyclase [Chloroflexota bacterium]